MQTSTEQCACLCIFMRGRERAAVSCGTRSTNDKWDARKNLDKQEKNWANQFCLPRIPKARSERDPGPCRSPAGQRWVLGYFKLIKHIQNFQHIQQCQVWTAPMIFLKKIVPFWNLKKNELRTDRPTIHPTDRRTHAHIEMGGPI